MRRFLQLTPLVCIALLTSRLPTEAEGLSPAAQIMAAIEEIEMCKLKIELVASTPIDWEGELDESAVPEFGDPAFDEADEDGDGQLTGSELDQFKDGMMNYARYDDTEDCLKEAKEKLDRLKKLYPWIFKELFPLEGTLADDPGDDEAGEKGEKKAAEKIDEETQQALDDLLDLLWNISHINEGMQGEQRRQDRGKPSAEQNKRLQDHLEAIDLLVQSITPATHAK